VTTPPYSQYPNQPTSGGYPNQPTSGGYGNQPTSGAFGNQPTSGGYGGQAGYGQQGQAGYGQGGQGGYGGGGSGDGIAFTPRFFPLAFILFLFKPFLSINGQQYQVPWGKRTVIPLPPGQYHVHAHTPYLLPPQVGKADLPVQVGGGQPIELEYKSPLFIFSAGSLGAPPQKYNGVLATVLLMVVPIVVLLICCCGSVFSSMFTSGS
jgi:hypothetical protein